MATITMATGGWLLLLVMMSMVMTVSSWPMDAGKLPDVLQN